MNFGNNMTNPDVITLNNHGAWNITLGNYEYAIKILSAAIKSIRIMNNKMTDLPRLPEQNLHCFMSDDRNDSNKEHYMPQRYPLDSNNVRYSLDQQRFTYVRPIEIPEWYSQLPGLHANTTITTTIIFNLALASHLSGIIADGTCASAMESQMKARLTTAATLYEHAIEMNWTKREEDAWAPRFLLASLNNLGQLYAILGEREASEKWFHCLLQYLMLITDLNNGDGLWLENFFMSVTHLIFRESSIPAAAA